MKRFYNFKKLSATEKAELMHTDGGFYLLDFSQATAQRLAQASKGFTAEALELLAGRKIVPVVKLYTQTAGARFYLWGKGFTAEERRILKGGSFGGSTSLPTRANNAALSYVWCTKCGRGFSSLDEYRAHRCHDDRPKCADCGAILKTPTEKRAGRCTACAKTKCATVYSYHGNPAHRSPRITNENREDFLTVGAEIEIGGGGEIYRCSSVPFLSETVNADPFRPMFHFETDGSIQNGVECISRPLSVREWKNARKKIKTFYSVAVYKGGKFATCNGLHFHLDRTFFNGSDGIPLMEFFIYKHFPELLYLSGRAIGGSDYATAKHSADTTLIKSILQYGRSTSRYHAVNTENLYTVELRFFGGHLDCAENFYGALELVNALAKWAKNATLIGASRATLSSIVPYINDAGAVLAHIENLEGKAYTKPELTSAERAELNAFIEALKTKKGGKN